MIANRGGLRGRPDGDPRQETPPVGYHLAVANPVILRAAKFLRIVITVANEQPATYRRHQ